MRGSRRHRQQQLALPRGRGGKRAHAGRNRAFQRRGQVFAVRYFPHVLRSPTETRRAVRYVLGNFAMHTWLLRDGWRRGVP